MGQRTGRPRGRPKGSKSRNTIKREQALLEASAAVSVTFPGAFEGDAHALLMAVYKNPDHPIDIRIDAAKAAIRYEKPALGSIDHTSNGQTIGYLMAPNEAGTTEEWEQQHSPTAH